MIVADTNLIAYMFTPSDEAPMAERVSAKDADWAVPFLWRSEFCNVLSLYMRRGTLALGDAILSFQNAENQIGGREYEVSSAHVLQLASISTCSAYDCEFVALAQELGVPLVTSDRRVLANFPNLAIVMDEFAE